jgi:hypothetical protein
MKITGRLVEFLKAAFWVKRLHSPPSWNYDAIIIIIGIVVWSACALGTAFNVAKMPPEVSQVGSTIFGVGIGRASKGSK